MPARLNFVPRKQVNDQLVDALRTPGKQLVIYGETGSGKTTLLSKKLEELYSGQITTRCHASLTFDQLLLDAFDQLDQYYIEGRKEAVDKRVSASVVTSFSRIRASIDSERKLSESQDERRVIPPQLTPQRLGELLGAQGLCWILEDFHKMGDEHKKPLAQVFKVFSDLSVEYPEVKIVAVGAANTAHEVVQYDPEMGNRVSELQVPLMNDEELLEILTNGQKLLNIDLTAVAESIVRYSTGLASACHQLALNLCLEKNVLATERQRVVFVQVDLGLALARYVAESSDTLKTAFDRALKRHKVRRYDNTRLILTALASGPLEGMLHAEILAKIRQTNSGYPPGNLTNYIDQLTTEDRGVVVRRAADGRYRYTSPLHHVFAQATFEPDEVKPKTDALYEMFILKLHGSLDAGPDSTDVSNWLKTDWPHISRPGDTVRLRHLLLTPRTEAREQVLHTLLQALQMLLQELPERTDWERTRWLLRQPRPLIQAQLALRTLQEEKDKQLAFWEPVTPRVEELLDRLRRLLDTMLKVPGSSRTRQQLVLHELEELVAELRRELARNEGEWQRGN